MSSRPHEPDLKNIWQNQETEKVIMSVEEVRLKASKFFRRKQLDLIARSAFVILAAVACGVFLMNARITSLRFVAGLVMAMLLIRTVWSLLRTYLHSRRDGPSDHAVSNAAITSCIEFYRSELQAYREYARLPAWQLATILLIIAWMTRDSLMRSGTDPFRIVLPYVLLAAAGMIVLVAVRKFQARRVQDDIEALDNFEDEMVEGGHHDATDEYQK